MRLSAAEHLPEPFRRIYRVIVSSSGTHGLPFGLGPVLGLGGPVLCIGATLAPVSGRHSTENLLDVGATAGPASFAAFLAGHRSTHTLEGITLDAAVREQLQSRSPTAASRSSWINPSPPHRPPTPSGTIWVIPLRVLVYLWGY